MNSELEKLILRTIVFFDVFEHCLTAEEAWRYCQLACTPDDASLALATLVYNGYLETSGGYFYLAGRLSHVERRKKGEAIAKRKLRIADKAVKLLSHVPGIKMAALCNSMVIGTPEEDSDIDLFIITRSGRIWLTRFLATIVLQLAGLRRHGRKVNDRICLSFYISEDHLALSDLMYQDDTYFYYWLATLRVLIDNDTAERFMTANQLANIFPNWKLDLSAAVSSDICHNSCPADKLGGWLEAIAKRLQLSKMSLNKKSLAGEDDSRVVISDTVLKFHERDRRAGYNKEYRARLTKHLP